ncbi:hypothetical protein BGY98DRAFT_729281 [Russula aff. rugulosa BPL654]|nr:hypothetical protein BGY98DRAFT_729281 [Russula aff. rugulosa BPL654]
MLKFSLTLAIILSSLYISFCQAQGTLSACAQNCSQSIGNEVGCNSYQLGLPNCVCLNAQFFPGASGCVWESCTTDEADTAESFWLGVCSAYMSSLSAASSASGYGSPSGTASTSTGYGATRAPHMEVVAAPPRALDMFFLAAPPQRDLMELAVAAAVAHHHLYRQSGGNYAHARCRSDRRRNRRCGGCLCIMLRVVFC